MLQRSTDCAHCRKTRFFYPMPFVYSIMRFLHDRDFSQIRGRFAQERPRSAVHRVREKSDGVDACRPPDRRPTGAARPPSAGR
ncbi:hypothetical protein L6Q82_34805, partial [Burkholderia cenocepacia]|uniref:hypothetical protein n=1 Tax=Burkholderia cenocepacia TaxID=95486 RepID=UPI001F3B7085